MQTVQMCPQPLGPPCLICYQQISTFSIRKKFYLILYNIRIVSPPWIKGIIFSGTILLLASVRYGNWLCETGAGDNHLDGAIKTAPEGFVLRIAARDNEKKGVELGTLEVSRSASNGHKSSSMQTQIQVQIHTQIQIQIIQRQKTQKYLLCIISIA